MFFLARLYARLPLILIAEKLGGTCFMCPVNFGKILIISFCVGRIEVSPIDFPLESSLSLDSPHLTTTSYHFVSSVTNLTTFVASPIAIGNIPVARGSKVPA